LSLFLLLKNLRGLFGAFCSVKVAAVVAVDAAALAGGYSARFLFVVASEAALSDPKNLRQN